MQERSLAAAHEALGSRYAALFAEGCRMAPEDAVARLLSGPPQVAAPSAR